MDRNEFLEKMEKVLTPCHFTRTDELFVFEVNLRTVRRKMEVLLLEGADITNEPKVPMAQLSIRLYTDDSYDGGIDVMAEYEEFDWLIKHVTDIFER